MMLCGMDRQTLRDWVLRYNAEGRHRRALLREFVVSVDTAHVRSADSKTARDFEIVIARCGRGGRGTPPGHYFAMANPSQLEMRARTLQALQCAM
jgi:hypothetical protein